MRIRLAKPEDASKLLEIYLPYVCETAISFEITPPNVLEFESRIRSISAEYPYLVCEENGIIAAYAYASAFHTREAYRNAVELSVYVDRNCRRSGVGTVLYRAMELLLCHQNVKNLYACITDCSEFDPYLPTGSVAFHQKRGFHFCGRCTECGFKFGRWYDTVTMEKILMPGKNFQCTFIPIDKKCAEQLLETYFDFEREIDSKMRE